MGRRRGGGGTKSAKRKRVTVSLVQEKRDGKLTEPYQILEDVRNSDHGDLEGAKIALAWRSGWRPD